MWNPVKHWRLVLTALFVAGLVLVALWPEAVEVDVVAVMRGPLQVTIDEEGETRVRERFMISAPVAGRVQRIDLEPGDPVSRGKTVLARIAPSQSALLDPRTQAELNAAVEASRATVGQARAERERADAALVRARASVQRQQNLEKAGAISQDELEAGQTTERLAEEGLRAADFSVSRAEYDLQTARARLQQPSATGGRTVEIMSPIDGVVLKRLRESEGVVPAGEPLLEIGDPTQLEVVADLLSADAVRVPPNARVLLEQWGGSRTLEGRVRRVEPSGFMKVSALGVEEQRVNVRIDFADPKAAQALGDGYRAEVRIVLKEEPDALKIPVGSLFRRGDDWAVFLVNGDHVRTEAVSIGERNPAEAQVVSGLTIGQRIVLHPPDTLADGTRITPR